MAEKKITELTALAAAPDNADLLMILDMSEADADKNKKITWANLVSNLAVTHNHDASQAAIPLLDIDWTLADYQYKSIAANSIFTFSNAADGLQITVAITADASDRNITLPAAVKWSTGVAPLTVFASTTTIINFVQINGSIYGSYMEDVQ